MRGSGWAVADAAGTKWPWNGRLVAVAFERSDEGILKLVLKGGENISWQ
jgi:hypothetical protein